MFEDPYILFAINCGLMSYILLVWSSLPKKEKMYYEENDYYTNECSWRKLLGRNQSKLNDEENPSTKIEEKIGNNNDTVIEIDPELYNEMWWG